MYPDTDALPRKQVGAHCGGVRMPRKGPPALAVDGEAAGFGGVGGGGANGNEGAPAFGITESGTFCKDDWRVKSTGIQQTPAGTGPVSTLRMADLQVEGTALASGASGSVRRAVHTPSGRIMAIKAIDVRVSGFSVSQAMQIEVG